MSHEHGAYLGGIRCLKTLRERCVMDKDGDCWHLRTARGRPMPTVGVYQFWVHGLGHCTATRGAWFLSGRPMPTHRGVIIFRSCESYDCVNPDHLRSGIRRSLMRHLVDVGRFESEARRAALETFKSSRPQAQIVTPELKAWLMESRQSGPDVAHALGVTPSRANNIRREMRKRPASVFNLGAGL
jgi:hypothetical protein